MMNRRRMPLARALVLALALLAPAPAAFAQLALSSPAFQDNQPIPLRNSAYGENISPAFAWSGAPDGTRSFVLVMVDESVPMPGGFVHWMLYNIPAAATGLPEGIPAEPQTLSQPAALAGTVQGLRGMNQAGYFGPRPPAANPPHNYVFTLYAVSVEPELASGLNRNQVLEAVEGRILGEARITGTYQGS